MSERDKTRDAANESSQAAERIGALLRASGRRPPIPPVRAARIEQTARAAWQEAVARRARGRRLVAWTALAAAAVVVVGAGLALRSRPTPPTVLGTIGRAELATGEVWLRATGDATAAAPARLHARDELAAGAEVTTGKEGRAALRLASGRSMRLDAGTSLRALSEGTFVLERGAVYVDSGGDARAAVGPIVIRTPLGEVRDIGTQFEVRMLETSLRIRVRVREGTVSLAGRGATHEMTAGEELTLDPAGIAARGRVDPYGPAWAWSESVARFGDLQGRSLREFLEWYARERGVRLELGQGRATEADTIILAGSIEGMTLEEAIDSVLATTEMRREEREGSLRIIGDDVAARP
jgi:hypothetical protein